MLTMVCLVFFKVVKHVFCIKLHKMGNHFLFCKYKHPNNHFKSVVAANLILIFCFTDTVYVLYLFSGDPNMDTVVFSSG